MRAIPDPFKKLDEKNFPRFARRGALGALGCFAARLLQPPHFFHASAAVGESHIESNKS